MSDLMQERLDRAERALTRAGFTYTEGAQEWKPPIGPSASPMLDRIDQLQELLRQCRPIIDDRADFGLVARRLLERIDAALAGKLPERPDTEWTDAAQATTEQDYRELQAQHDQVQSRLKAALDVVREARISVEFRHSTTTNFGGTVTTGRLLEKIDALLAGQVPAQAVPEGWQLVPVEPTEEILRAIRSCVLVESCYSAMLAAAPKPEAKP